MEKKKRKYYEYFYIEAICMPRCKKTFYIEAFVKQEHVWKRNQTTLYPELYDFARKKYGFNFFHILAIGGGQITNIEYRERKLRNNYYRNCYVRYIGVYSDAKEYGIRYSNLRFCMRLNGNERLLPKFVPYDWDTLYEIRDKIEANPQEYTLEKIKCDDCLYCRFNCPNALQNKQNLSRLKRKDKELYKQVMSEIELRKKAKSWVVASKLPINEDLIKFKMAHIQLKREIKLQEQNQ